MGWRAVKRTRVHEDIAAQIRRQVVAGRLNPGDQLPSERELSERFRASRTSVREALRTLESTGLVRIRSGDGTYVASGLEGLDPPRQTQSALRDAFEARKIIEPEIAALAAAHATEAEIGRLDAVLQAQAKDVDRGGTGMEADATFHSLLARATKNDLLSKLNGFIAESLRDLVKQSMHADGRPTRSVAGHRAIVEALRNRDPEGARLAMARHLEDIEKSVQASETNNRNLSDRHNPRDEVSGQQPGGRVS